MTKLQQIANLERLRALKERRMRLKLWKAKKEGQIDKLKHLHYQIRVNKIVINVQELPAYISREIEKEMKDLEIIENDLSSLKREFKALT